MDAAQVMGELSHVPSGTCLDRSTEWTVFDGCCKPFDIG